VGSDVPVRDWQQDTPTTWPGKSFDTHGPIGPWVVTADEVDPAGLGIRTWVDGELRQDGSTKEMVAGIGDMIAALSRVCTLEPGDLIATGTPGVSVCSADGCYDRVSGSASRSRASARSRTPSPPNHPPPKASRPEILSRMWARYRHSDSFRRELPSEPSALAGSSVM
jgi:hypothetical protein